ncbi:MAG TPA: type IX secretion system membrane protein PorP/SprF, partial [Saprospiraceae bacterium]|nr:type IX secretion system membrane protein PorP/SprF [Saprospiraceae bacterium]
MKSRTLFAATCLLLAHFALAQDFTFSQYAAMPYLINPATTGQVPTFTPLNQNVEHNYQHRVALLARNHWSVPGSVNGLSAAAAGWDMRFCNGQGDNYFFGLGAYMQGDYAGLGDYFNLNMRGMASFAHQLAGDAWLSYGLSAGWLQYGVQPHELTFDGQLNPVS